MIRATIAFLACVLTAVQGFAHYFDGQTICFTDGCAIVDSMTRVSPLYFNIAGFFYFLILFWCLVWGRGNGSEHWHKFARLLLLAGLAAEAVLLFFQYSIAMVFCSYCTLIFGIIVLLNILSGPRQVFRGMVLFSAVTLVCFSLNFRGETGVGGSLDEGSMAMVKGTREETKLYLFFSATCPHCEKVLDNLKRENNCTLRFNPIEKIEAFSFPNHQSFVGYSTEINLKFLNTLSLTEIPVLVAKGEDTVVVMKGERQINQYLVQKCQQGPQEGVDYSGSSNAQPTTGYTGFIGQSAAEGDDACKVAEDCEPEVPETEGEKTY